MKIMILRLQKARLSALIGFAVFLGYGCSNMRYLDEEQRLYTGSRIYLEAEGKLSEEKMLEEELQGVIRPIPNQRFLIWRPRLWFYHVAGKPTGKGLRHLMKNRFGRPPVLYNPDDVQRNKRLMENRLFNMGYFDASVSEQVRLTDQTASVGYHVTLKSPYVFGTLAAFGQSQHADSPGPERNMAEQRPDSLAEGGVRAEGVNQATGSPDTEIPDVLSHHVNGLLAESVIRSGSPYRLEALKRERMRIDRGLKQLGYFYFHPDHLLFLADTLNSSREVDIHPTIKTGIPANAMQRFRLGEMHVVTDYMVHQEDLGARDDGLVVEDGLIMYDALEQFRPGVVDRALFLRPGDMYSLDNHDRSLAHLSGLGVFSFVNMRFEPRQAGDGQVLDVRILLAPAPRKKISTEVRGVSKSNSFAGPGLSASFSNINLSGGAELFKLSLTASYEALISRQLASASSWEIGLESGLVMPGFVLLPAWLQGNRKQFVPGTHLSLGVNFLNRTDAFGLTSVKMNYRYEWNQNLFVRHRFSPVVFNFFLLGQVSGKLDRSLAGGTLLRRGLFEQFIFGAEYSWFYNSQQRDRERRLNDYYANVNLDLSGNMLGAVSGLFGRARDDDGYHTYFGKGFAQYSKIDFDLRYYRRLGGGQRLATRMIAGLGLPYGNSTSLPYLKLFTIGGSNSLRAFQPRSLGPGAYAPPDSLAGSFNIYQSGEVKLEWNAEYRFDLSAMIKGAVFVDAGNIWRLKPDEQVQGGQFMWDTFISQMALGTGAGIRLDLTFFILRLDMAFPLAVPYRERSGFFEPVQPLKRQWRRDNLVLNLAIGYPF